MPALSKSRFMAGIQCIKRLWFTVHEPHATELVPDEHQLWLFEHGHRVGEAARAVLGPGPVIPASPTNKALQVARTQHAIEAGEQRIFEAAFQHDGVFVAVDALERDGDGWTVIEVKSSTKLKPEHVVDVAVQVHVLQGCGLEVRRAEVMHLNPEHRHPDINPLFCRAPVHYEVARLLPMVPQQLNQMLAALEGREPEVPPGVQCTRPYDCPFLPRCHRPAPRNHVSELYAIRRDRVDKLIEQGFDNIAQLPATTKLSKVQQRQRRAVIENKTVVEPGLGRVLDALEGPLGFLDFETVGVPLPVWDGTRPWEQVPVQFSAWVEREDGAVVTHHPFLASGRDDPRPELARKLVDVFLGAEIETVLAWNAHFEIRCILGLAEIVPELRDDLEQLADRVVDLLKVVREHVYHVEFRGSFALKRVAPVFAAGNWGTLDVADGQSASIVLERYLLEGKVPQGWDEARARRALVKYCSVDTLAVAKVLQTLRKLAA